MKRLAWLTTISMAAFSIAAVGAVAQDTPPPADPPVKEGEQEPEEKQVPIKWNELSVGYTTFKGKASLRQYARPTEGFSIHRLKFFTPGTDTFPYAKLTIRGVPKQDNLIDGVIMLNRGTTVVRARRSHYEFYAHDWRARGLSGESETAVTVDQAIGTDFGAFASYKAGERDGRYPAPREADHTTTQVVAGGFGGKVLGGNLGVTISGRRNYDNTGKLPGNIQRRIDASYSHDIGNNFNIEGNAGYTRIEQTGLKNSGIKTYSFAGALDLGPATGLQFQFGRQDLDLNTISNAYARKRVYSGARLIHRWPKWSLQLGFKHRETERVRADQSFVDVPKVNDYDVRVAGRIGAAKVTIKGSWEDLRATAVMTTADTRQLLWDDRATFQTKIDGGNDKVAAYGVYTYRFQQNKQRAVEIGWHNLAVGASYVFGPALDGYAEFSADNFKAKGGAETGQTLDFYFPNARSAALGLNWAKDASSSASASLNFYETGDVKGAQLTLSYHRTLSPDRDLEIVVAPWRQSDRLYGVTGYRTTFLMIVYTVRF